MYTVPPPKFSLPENRFSFELEAPGKPGKTQQVSFPKIEYIDRPITKLFIAQSKRRDRMKEDGEDYLILHEVEEWIEIFSALSPAHRDAFEALSNDQVMDLSKVWLEASKVDILPESEASSDS